MTQEEIQKIEDKMLSLFNTYRLHTMFDSTGRLGHFEWQELVDYCKEHTDIFKIFAREILEKPGEYCVIIPMLCKEVLPDIADEITKIPKSLVQKLSKIKDITIESLGLDGETIIWGPCDLWLNYFKGTTGVKYFKDYIDYKKYLDKHYISWKPNEEDDPNPTYEEYLKNRDKYKIQ